MVTAASNWDPGITAAGNYKFIQRACPLYISDVSSKANRKIRCVHVFLDEMLTSSSNAHTRHKVLMFDNKQTNKSQSSTYFL